MTTKDLEQAKRNAILARARLDSSVGALQLRLRPGNLATEAWDGVKDKSETLAEGALDAVKKRPAAVSLAIGAFALFLAREPLKRVVTRMWNEGEEDEGRITTVIPTENENFSAAAPTVAASVTEGVS
ncbi:MAG TPA: DUF3618 domain-containing protein [Allosphingosinicella sp.]|nr:DUF3618 domain-containing protein [Allosphingosinicella sp.]